MARTIKAKSVARAKGAGADRNLSKLREIVKLLESSTLAELSYEDADIAVEVRRYSSSAPAPAPAAPVPAAVPTAPSSPPPELESDVHVVRSPFVGTFYTSPNPGEKKFVEVGSVVSPGEALCIVEAMKLMNRIESEVAGTIVAVLAENGRTVQYGDALFKINTRV